LVRGQQEIVPLAVVGSVRSEQAAWLFAQWIDAQRQQYQQKQQYQQHQYQQKQKQVGVSSAAPAPATAPIIAAAPAPPAQVKPRALDDNNPIVAFIADEAAGCLRATFALDSSDPAAAFGAPALQFAPPAHAGRVSRNQWHQASHPPQLTEPPDALQPRRRRPAGAAGRLDAARRRGGGVGVCGWGRVEGG